MAEHRKARSGEVGGQMSDLNISAVKKHALACSVANRGAKFSRVGQDFIDEVCAEVEALVRELNVRFPVKERDIVCTPEVFVTGPLLEKLRDPLNAAIARIIQNKVQRQPSVGVTLGRTR